MKKIYIAGKISGECETPELIDKCRNKFMNYGKSLGEDFYRSFEPHSIFIYNENKSIAFTNGFLINKDLIPNGTWQQYMKNDISILLECDEIHMLPDWRDSVGATIEHNLAIALDIKVIYVS